MASMRVTAFTNTFLVSNNGHGGPTLKVVGPLEARKKRPHRVCCVQRHDVFVPGGFRRGDQNKR